MDSTTLTPTPPVRPDPQLYRPADVAHRAGCHPSTVKAIAQTLQLDVARCPDGSRIFTAPQAAQIINEVARRKQEALRK
jgi:hypothetical protein